MFGYMGQSLRVDLSTGEMQQKEVDPKQTMPYIGGRGIGIKLLCDTTSAGVDPLSPENPLILATGPYTGTGLFSAMFNVTTKSPLTGIAASSHCGGQWGPKLKKAGFDGLIITGAAKTPCYLMIDEGKATIKDAQEIWGQGVFATEEFIRQREGGSVQVLGIGQAGENLVRFAAMMNGHRAVGRSGVGAVMGYKKLKAIAVKGNLPINIHDNKKLAEISRTGSKIALEKGANFAKHGTPLAFSFFNEKHVLPTRYFRQGYFEDANQIDAVALKDRYFVRDLGCYKCPLKCSKIHAVKEGPYALSGLEGPEYETLMALGSGCGNANLESILTANYLCNDLGMDTISCGNILGLLMDLCDLGIIGPSQLEGMTFKWGDHAAMIAMIPKIAHRQGVGNLLAEGSLAAAAHWGQEALNRVIHSKKQEFPGYEFRRSFGTGFSLVTSNRGACHLRAAFYVNEIFLNECEKGGFENNINLLLDKEHLMAIDDSMAMCKFGQRNAQFTWPIMADLLTAVTGFHVSADQLKLTGERIWNLERLYNVREGIEADLPPDRFLREGLSDGKAGGDALDKERFLKARTLYYQKRGWNDDGHPNPEKLEELGLQ